jgi:hypothetical protein
MNIVIQKLADEFPDLAEFDDKWPIHEYIKQHIHDYRGRNVTPAAVKKRKCHNN